LRIFVLFLALLLGCSRSDPAPWTEVTEEYELPKEMQGCRIFILGGGWSGANPIWVVVSPSGEVTTAR
jgi:hypothetical protein